MQIVTYLVLVVSSSLYLFLCMCLFQKTDKDVQPCEFGEIVSSLSRDSTGKSDSRKSKSTRIELSRFAKQHICKSVEWQLLEENEDKLNKPLRVVVGRTDATNNESSANATKVEMLKDLESVFFTVYKQNYSFGSKSKTTTLFDNDFKLALEIRTLLNADDLKEIENLCSKLVPNDALIYSVDLELNLSSGTAFNISTQLPCLLSKQTIFKLSGLQMSITNIDNNGNGHFEIMGVDKEIDTVNRPSDTNLVMLCDNKVEAGRKIISMDGYHCRTTIDLPRH